MHPDKLTGFKFDNRQKAWVETSFSPSRKYLVKNRTEEEGYIFQEFGQQWIKRDCGLMGKDGLLYCTGSVGTVCFMSKTLRYTKGLIYEYTNNETWITPNMEIGTCSTL